MTTSAPRTSQSATAAPAEQGYTRLHISPLDPELLKIIVPSAVLPRARDISYHTIQTRPERPYGFVELPSADAEKIKRKLNGAVLKGNKIRIEPARPDNMPKPSADALVDTATGADIERKSKKSKKDKKDKKRKRDPQEIVGVELEEGRKVKRGWTLTPEEAQSKKKKEREREKKSKKSSKDKKEKSKKRREPESEYTEGPECLVKTRIPPNKRDIGVDNGGDDDGNERKKKSKKHKKHDVVVHEFENTTKFPTFLKASSKASKSEAPTEFVKGKGWVDDEGQVVEEVKSTRPEALPKVHVETKKRKQPEPVIEDDTTSSSGSSEEEEEEDDDDDDDDEDEDVQDGDVEKQAEIGTEPEKHTATAPEHGLNPQATPARAGSNDQSEPSSPESKSAGSPKNLTIRVPPATPSSTKVHPLEALYKKQQQAEAKADAGNADAEPFSFFGGGDDIEDDEDDMVAGVVNEDADDGQSQTLQLPMTPYSKQDFESRGLRSAAPTPDTAHPSRFSRFWTPGGERDGPSDVEEEDFDHDMISNKGDGSDNEAGDSSTNPNTDFQKWFWEHRGDLNRSWKKRRKMAAKEKRYRENRARADRAI